MWKNHKKTVILTILLTLVPTVVGLLLWNRLPEQMATHFGIGNEPNGWSGRGFTVFGIRAIMAALEVFCIIATDMDPKSKNISGKAMVMVLWIMPVLSWVVMGMTYAFALEYKPDVGMICCLISAVVLIALGNYMPKTKQNYTVGVRVSWALEDEENWYHTHRFAGFVYTIGGILIAIAALLHLPLWVLIVVMAVVILVPVLYSWLYYRKHR